MVIAATRELSFEVVMYKEKLLIVEDYPEISERLQNYLQNEGFEVAVASNAAAAERLWSGMCPDLTVIDCDLRDPAALNLMSRLRSLNRSVPVITLAGYGSLELGIESVRLGAEQFLTKPIDPATLRIVIVRTLENERNRRARLAETAHGPTRIVDPLMGNSDVIKKLRDTGHRVAVSDSPVLIEGEVGTGKGELAHWLHQIGPRSNEPFVRLNAASQATQIESELFANKITPPSTNHTRPDLREIAHHGTLFIDSIGELPQLTQAKFLRFLEVQIGVSRDKQDRKFDIRLMAASHRSISHLVQNRHFRAELYFRLRTILVKMPPLRERVDDIPIIAEHLLQRLAADLGKGEIGLSRSTIDILKAYTWPGNLRELKTVLERAILLANNSTITEIDLNLNAPSSQDVRNQSRTLEEIERSYIQQILEREGGRVEAAAKRLGIPRSSLYHKLKQYREEEPQLRSVS